MAEEENSSTGPARPPTADELGIAGYEEFAPIGQGGFGWVFEARQTAFDRRVAIKILASPVNDTPTRMRFERECRAIGMLSGHPNIVTVYESGITKWGRPYIAMDLMTGGSLADHLTYKGAIDWKRTLEIGVALSGAVETAHRVGILHRDIKPENVLISGYGEPKLADFGISTLPGGHQTTSGVITASLLHVAPEVLSGEKATEASDVYSLASTLFTLLSGRAPFARETDELLPAMITRILTQSVPDLRAFDVPDDLCALLERAMEKEPSRRLSSALEVGTELQRVQRGAGLPVLEMSTVDPSTEVRHEYREHQKASFTAETRHRARPEIVPGNVAASAGRSLRAKLLAGGAICALVAGAAWAYAVVGRDDDKPAPTVQTAADEGSEDEKTSEQQGGDQKSKTRGTKNQDSRQGGGSKNGKRGSGANRKNKGNSIYSGSNGSFSSGGSSSESNAGGSGNQTSSSSPQTQAGGAQSSGGSQGGSKGSGSAKEEAPPIVQPDPKETKSPEPPPPPASPTPQG